MGINEKKWSLLFKFGHLAGNLIKSYEYMSFYKDTDYLRNMGVGDAW